MLFQKNKQKKYWEKLPQFTVILIISFISIYGAHASESLPNFIFQGYLEKANAGDANAQFSLGFLNEKELAPNASIIKSIEWYEKAAKNGHVKAAMSAANLLLVDKNNSNFTSRAIVMLKIASEAGLPDATYNLGYMYETGMGMPKDVGLALELFQSSAIKGHVASMRQIGMIYWYGHDVEKDELVAKDWLMRAASNGDQAAASLLEKINNLDVK